MNYITSVLAVRHVSASTQEDSHSNPLAQRRDLAQSSDSFRDARSMEKSTPNGPNGETERMTSLRVKRQTTVARTKSTLYFCRPPPTARQKRLQFRPKILLQLQRKSDATRPIPTFDVLSTNGFASRLAKEFPDTFKGKYGLGIDDLVVVGSEKYSPEDLHVEDADESQQKDSWKKRNIVAAIAHCGDDKHGGRSPGVDICLSRGRSWMGLPMPKGGYEFVSVDQEGFRTTARWVPRRTSRRHSAGPGTSSLASPVEGRAFNFSLIDPNSRRHAVIATLDTPTLEIVDRFNASLPESTDPSSAEVLTDSSMEVDEDLRALIVVTSIWISLCEGFFGNDHAAGDSIKAQTISPFDKRRSLSIKTKEIHKQNTSLSTSSSTGVISQHPLSIRQSPSKSTAPTSPVNKPLMSPPFLTPPRRTQSTGPTILDRLHPRHPLANEAETLSPISDVGDGSPVATRTSASIEHTRNFQGQGRNSVQLSRSNKEQGKRISGIKKFYSSLKKSVRGDPSEQVGSM